MLIETTPMFSLETTSKMSEEQISDDVRSITDHTL